jgi:hypothetical protein
MEIPKRARIDDDTSDVWLTHENVQLRATREAMENDFGRRRLVTWMLIAKHLGIPMDVAKLICSKVPRDYRKHPVYEFLNSRSIEARMTHTVIVDTTKNPAAFLFDPPRDFAGVTLFLKSWLDAETRTYVTGVGVFCCRFLAVPEELKNRDGIKVFTL